LEQQIPCVVVLNKIDTLNQYQRKAIHEKLDQVLLDFQIPLTGPESAQGLLAIIDTSTSDNTGIKTLKGVINTRSIKIDYSHADPRNELYKFPSVGGKKKPSDSAEPQDF
jgi:GTP-binding protein EngB required for normal cell division